MLLFVSGTEPAMFVGWLSLRPFVAWLFPSAMMITADWVDRAHHGRA